jgi:hypothetical protein
MSSTIGFRPARNLAGGSRYIETQPVGDALILLSQNAAFEVFENHIMKEIPVGT